MLEKIKNEYELLETTKNPFLDDQTDYIFVLSARYNLDGKPLNQVAQNRASTNENKNLSDLDYEDTLERIIQAIELGVLITASKKEIEPNNITINDLKNNGPKIIFNGLDAQNQQLLEFLENKKFKPSQSLKKLYTYAFLRFDNTESILLSDLYPKNLFITLYLEPNQRHTKGQFESLSEYCKSGKLGKLPKITIITHSYHGPRTARYIELLSPKYNPNPISNPNINMLYLIDSANRPSYQQDRQEEICRLLIYPAIFGLAEKPPENIYANRSKLKALSSSYVTIENSTQTAQSKDDNRTNYTLKLR